MKLFQQIKGETKCGIVNTMEHEAATERNEAPARATTCMNLEHTVLSGKKHKRSYMTPFV